MSDHSTPDGSQQTKPLSGMSTSRAISVLPREVVDQIAAGEVVQRPASVVKELLENCLDAGSTHIVVKVEKGGLSKLSITDDGCGISKTDLALAATRHATSKLASVQDFHKLETFGFRGEALASISMVSRLTITSRTKDSAVAFSLAYSNGTPNSPTPKPCARKPGTTIMVEDLFHNVPHRLKTFSKRESDEYAKILAVVQGYAVHYPHCAFCLERRLANKATLVDINTSQLKSVKDLVKKRASQGQPSKEAVVEATIQIMSHVLEPNLHKSLSHLECSAEGKEPSEFTFSGEIYYSKPSSGAKKSHFLLFLNNRLVDLPVLKRTLEDAYSDFGTQQQKPVLVVNVTVPSTQVDVNVHPSKRQVALMYQDELCLSLSTELRKALKDQGQTFQAESVAPTVKNPYKSSTKKRPVPTPSPKTDDGSSEETEVQAREPVHKKKTPASQLVRTSKAAPVGAIRPFLVPTQPTPPSPSSSPAKEQEEEKSGGDPLTGEDVEAHKEDCPLFKKNGVDLSQPGAFALRCTCTVPLPPGAVLVKKPIVRPKKVVPTKCTYASIMSLRKRVNKHSSVDLAKQLREAYLVGVVSPYRALVQCGEELVLIHHLQLAKELFYQLALARFGGGATMARFGGGKVGFVNIHEVIAQALQLEDDLVTTRREPEKLESLSQRSDLLEVNDMNKKLARHATACLMDHAEMLEEYFSIGIEKQGEDIFLTGLPVLLDGHAPEPHGLAIFLLRLATLVEWSEERLCFHGICEELGNYYALLPTKSEEVTPHVQHVLFPAISYLLLPSERHKKEGNITVMTKLSTLYKVFERC